MPRNQFPNILLIMSDEHAPMYSGPYGHPLVQTPNMDRLAENGITFENAYCNSPLCMPSRMSFMTGRYIHKIGAWDNAAPLRPDAVTWAHHLRSAGYDVVLSGKQHFGGMDQLHGYRTQLARDLHAERQHGLTDWEKGTPPAARPWQGLAGAGPGTTKEIEIDDLAEVQAITYLRETHRKDQPWVLNVSFIAPHFPLVVPQRFWDLYPIDEIDMPNIPDGHLENQHPVYQRMRGMFGCIDFPEELVRCARIGYYGLITYLDEKIGNLLETLEETGQLENTIVIYTSDHGEMNGEHGMWRKSNFYEASVRIPLQIMFPDRLQAGRRIAEVVSLVDLTATLVDFSGDQEFSQLDGESLLPLIHDPNLNWKDSAFSEYLAHGVQRPMAMYREGKYKYNYSLGDPPELYDISKDPDEFDNLADKNEYQEICNSLALKLLEQWDPIEIEKQVCESQKARLLIDRTTKGQWRKHT
ncbi:choline-sulfatase [Candidatus Poribacteria bacterium]|nr:MAG: choline-sulfatase [Candidatus Poribacteria bacterium]